MAGLKYDTGKLKYHLIPPEAIKAIAEILTYGAEKYHENSWQGLDDFDNRYYDALMRHIEAWRQGENIDSESGKLHLAHAATNAVFLLWKNLGETAPVQAGS
jgi:hypothetical protein